MTRQNVLLNIRRSYASLENRSVQRGRPSPNQLSPSISIEGSGYPIGAFAIAIAPFLLSAVKDIVVAWVRVRGGRKVRVKIGDTHVEGHTPEEIEKVLKAAAEFKQSSKPAKRGKP